MHGRNHNKETDSGTGDEDIAQEILTVEDIPDKALYAAILNYADSNGDGMIQKAEAAGIYFLSVYETVKDYTGLEYLTNLNSLFLAVQQMKTVWMNYLKSYPD